MHNNTWDKIRHSRWFVIVVVLVWFGAMGVVGKMDLEDQLRMEQIKNDIFSREEEPE